jgi:hypothetical protein
MVDLFLSNSILPYFGEELHYYKPKKASIYARYGVSQTPNKGILWGGQTPASKYGLVHISVQCLHIKILCHAVAGLKKFILSNWSKLPKV